jgi:primosomal protein N' (replication factor Y)
MLYHPDFRAFERSFQMMVQVSGRSGTFWEARKSNYSTHNPNHNTIQQVTNNDYLGMYNEHTTDRFINTHLILE